MKNLSIRILLYACIAMFIISCGTRKVESEKIRTENSTLNESSNEGQSDKSSAITTQDKALSTNTTTNKTTEISETTYLDKVTGKPTKVVKSTKTGDYTNTQITIKKTVTNTITHDVEKWKIKNKVVTNTLTVYKSKKSTSSRNGLYVLGGFGFLILGVLAWLKWVR